MPAKKNIVKEIKDACTDCQDCQRKCSSHHSHPGMGGGIYGLGLLGAAIYFFQHMPVREDILFAIFKVIFWPAFLVYRLLEKNLL